MSECSIHDDVDGNDDDDEAAPASGMTGRIQTGRTDGFTSKMYVRTSEAQGLDSRYVMIIYEKYGSWVGSILLLGIRSNYAD